MLLFTCRIAAVRNGPYPADVEGDGYKSHGLSSPPSGTLEMSHERKTAWHKCCEVMAGQPTPPNVPPPEIRPY